MRVVPPIALSALLLLAPLVGCDAPLQSEQEIPTLRLTSPGGTWILIQDGTIELQGTASDSSGIVSVSYEYGGGRRNDLPIRQGEQVEFSAEIAAVPGVHELRVYATDPWGNTASREVEVRATTARLNAEITLHYSTDESTGGDTVLHRVRGTAPGIERLTYASIRMSREGGHVMTEGEIALSQDSARAFDELVPVDGEALYLYAYDPIGVRITRSAHGLVNSPPEIVVSPAPAQRFIDDSAALELSVMASAGWTDDVVERVEVRVAEGAWDRIDVSPGHDVEFTWSPTLTGQVTRVSILVETRVGHVRIISFVIVRVPDASVPGEYLSVATSTGFTCAVTFQSETRCWGDDRRYYYPQGFEPSLLPVPAHGGWSFSRLFGGSHAMCGLVEGGAAYCWGENDAGQLGDGSTTYRTQPSAVSGGLSFSELSLAGGRTCGIAADGSAACWGAFAAVHVNDGGEPHSSVPVEVPGGVSFREISAAPERVCGVSTGGAVLCWGTAQVPEPAPVTASATFTGIATNNTQLCAVDDDGGLWCWRRNGTDPLDWPSELTLVAADLDLASVVAAGELVCGISSDGSAYCWGIGPLGAGDAPRTWQNPAATPVPVAGNLSFRSLHPEGGHVCGLTTADAVYCWGTGRQGQLGNGTRYTLLSPVRVLEPAP